jgi:Holliday junction resolvase-like predicted endonuclease
MKKLILTFILLSNMLNASIIYDKCRISQEELFKKNYPYISVNDICYHEIGEKEYKKSLFFKIRVLNCEAIFNNVEKKKGAKGFTEFKIPKDKVCAYHYADNEKSSEKKLNFALDDKLIKKNIDLNNQIVILKKEKEILQTKLKSNQDNRFYFLSVSGLLFGVILILIYFIFLKKKKRNIQKENIQKGKAYEEFVAKYYREKNYQVIERGKEKQRKDGGIDLIVKKDNNCILIQCKNYAPTSKINHSNIKEFNSNCLTYIQEHKLNETQVSFLYVVPNYESFKNCAIKYFQARNNKCRYKIIKF